MQRLTSNSQPLQFLTDSLLLNASFIARSVHKNFGYILFNEATNALDTKNERVIMDNLDRFFKGRTVVVVAHRLSTVRIADQIVVLEKGRIVEKGTHSWSQQAVLILTLLKTSWNWKQRLNKNVKCDYK